MKLKIFIWQLQNGRIKSLLILSIDISIRNVYNFNALPRDQTFPENLTD